MPDGTTNLSDFMAINVQFACNILEQNQQLNHAQRGLVSSYCISLRRGTRLGQLVIAIVYVHIAGVVVPFLKLALKEVLKQQHCWLR